MLITRKFSVYHQRIHCAKSGSSYIFIIFHNYRFQQLGSKDTNSASLDAISAIVSSTVLRPVRDASRGLTSRRASYVVLCTMGTNWSRASEADRSLSAMPSCGSRLISAGVTNTSPIRELAKPLSMARINGTPSVASFSCSKSARRSSRQGNWHWKWPVSKPEIFFAATCYVIRLTRKLSTG